MTTLYPPLLPCTVYPVCTLTPLYTVKGTYLNFVLLPQLNTDDTLLHWTLVWTRDKGPVEGQLSPFLHGKKRGDGNNPSFIKYFFLLHTGYGSSHR